MRRDVGRQCPSIWELRPRESPLAADLSDARHHYLTGRGLETLRRTSPLHIKHTTYRLPQTLLAISFRDAYMSPTTSPFASS